MQLESKKTMLIAGLLLNLISINTQASLIPYSSGGQKLVYSSASDITWTGYANLVNTIISTIGTLSDTPNAYDTPANSGTHTLSTAEFGAFGLVNWFGAKAFSSYLNFINYAGSNRWELPYAGDHPQVGYNLTVTQFGQLFFDELGIGVNNHITDTEYSPAPNAAWDFDTNSGALYKDFKNGWGFAWAVSPGQIAAVPVPGAVWLFGSGLIGFLG